MGAKKVTRHRHNSLVRSTWRTATANCALIFLPALWDALDAHQHLPPPQQQPLERVMGCLVGKILPFVFR